MFHHGHTVSRGVFNGGVQYRVGNVFPICNNRIWAIKNQAVSIRCRMKCNGGGFSVVDAYTRYTGTLGNGFSIAHRSLQLVQDKVSIGKYHIFSRKMSPFLTTFSNILGIGIDLVDVRRIERAMIRYPNAFVRRIFTDQERDYSQRNRRPYLSYAKRFAAKEAFAKATGLGIGSAVGWRDVEILSLTTGQPHLQMSDRCQQALNALWNQPIQGFVSLSDEFPYAQAFVVLVGLSSHNLYKNNLFDHRPVKAGNQDQVIL
jgi:holo-[acyl-carrier protein] synthase